MGYSTEFFGEFSCSPSLTTDQIQYLTNFANSRRMMRDASIAENIPDHYRESVNLPIGEDGEYFVNGTGWMGQNSDKSVLNYNCPPASQPSLWCQWIPTESGDAIVWDGGEKFYSYIEWIKYIIQHFMIPWGIVINGEVEWEGEERDDLGIIIVENNEVIVKEGTVTYS